MAEIDLVLKRDRKSQETQKKILDATDRLLRQYGFRYVTVRNICKESGAAYGSFYHHFGTKENLLYNYGKRIYEKNRDNNPMPSFIQQGDYVHGVMWYLLVYALFCEAMGKDFIHYLNQYQDLDMFADTFRTHVTPLVEDAGKRGYIISGPSHTLVRMEKELLRDIQIIYRGIIMWWAVQKDDDEPLAEVIEHILIHRLTSSATPALDELVGKKYMLTDGNYWSRVHLEGIPENFASRNEEQQEEAEKKAAE